MGPRCLQTILKTWAIRYICFLLGLDLLITVQAELHHRLFKVRLPFCTSIKMSDPKSRQVCFHTTSLKNKILFDSVHLNFHKRFIIVLQG